MYRNFITKTIFRFVQITLSDFLGNPLVCDCELRWYKQWIEDEWNPVEEQWLQDTYCTSPKDGRKHKIHEVELKDMFCDSSVKDKAGRVSFYTKKIRNHTAN